MKKTTLTILIDLEKQQILMIFKKRGQGMGKWNFPGGKIAEGESAEAAAMREVQEETGLSVSSLREAAYLEFHFPRGGSWSNSCQVFLAQEFSGTLQKETEECEAHWVSLDNIPFEKMWPNDRLWVPDLLRGEFVKRSYTFDENDQPIREEKIV